MNWGIKVLQTFALPLGHGTMLACCRSSVGYIKSAMPNLLIKERAVDEARTRDLHLGKVALYRMSYTRIWCLRSELNQRHADFQSAALPTELQRHIVESLSSPQML